MDPLSSDHLKKKKKKNQIWTPSDKLSGSRHVPHAHSKDISPLICIVFQGLYLEIYGPTLIDLKLKIGADYEQIATAISGRGVGVFVGCVVWGILVDKFLHWSHVFIAIALGIAAIVTVVAPWSPNVELLYLWCAVGGFAEVAIGIGKHRKYTG